MIAPNCPDHDRLALDLALGRLDDEAAIEAESISESCPVCRAWWHEQFGGEAVEAVDHVVSVTFGDLQLPTRRHHHGWMAVAAALVMAVGGGTLWVSQHATTTHNTAAARTASIQTLDFEIPEAVSEFAVIEIPDPDPEPEVTVRVEEKVVAEIVVAEASPTKAAGDEASKTLFAGGFESGDLGAWVPKT